MINDELLKFEYDADAAILVEPVGQSFQFFTTPLAGLKRRQSPDDRRTAALIGSLAKQHDLFVDVGAHHGFFSVLAAQANPRLEILSLEPVPASFRILQRNLEALGTKKTDVLQQAMSSDAGPAQFRIAAVSNDCGFSSVLPRGHMEVQTATLDSLLDGRFGRRTLIRISTGGHEPEVLLGLADALQRIKDLSLVVEFNPALLREAGHNPIDLLTGIEKAGFDLFDIDEGDGLIYPVRASDAVWTSDHAADSRNIYCSRPGTALNVLFFVHSAGLGGAERSLLELVAELTGEYRVLCTVVVPGPGALQDLLVKAGASVLIDEQLTQWTSPSYLSDLDQMRRRLADGSKALFGDLLSKLRRLDPDLVFSQTITVPWGAAAAATLNKPHIWSICEFGQLDHDLAFTSPFESITAEIAGGGSFIFAACDEIRKVLFPQLPPDIIQPLLRHVAVPKKLKPRTELFRIPGATRLALIGTITEGKGQLDAIRAVQALVSRGRNVELLLAGYLSPEFAPDIEAAIGQLKLDERVRVVEFMTDPYPAMLAADIVLVCSRYEAFGRVAAEGMLLGCAVIYPRSGGIPEYMIDGATGLSYAPGDHLELCARIEELIDAPERIAELGKVAKLHATGLLTKERYGGKVYRQMRDMIKNDWPAPSIPQDITLAMVAAIEHAGGKIATLEADLQTAQRRISQAEAAAAAQTEQAQLAQQALAERDQLARDLTTQLAEWDQLARDLTTQLADADARTENGLELARTAASERGQLTRDLTAQLAELELARCAAFEHDQLARDLRKQVEEFAREKAEIGSTLAITAARLDESHGALEALAREKAEIVSTLAITAARLDESRSALEALAREKAEIGSTLTITAARYQESQGALEALTRAKTEIDSALSLTSTRLLESKEALAASRAIEHANAHSMGRLQDLLSDNQAKLAQLEHAHRAVVNSTAWRASGPARAVASYVPIPIRRAIRRLLLAMWWTISLQLPSRLRQRRKMLDTRL